MYNAFFRFNITKRITTGVLFAWYAMSMPAANFYSDPLRTKTNVVGSVSWLKLTTGTFGSLGTSAVNGAVAADATTMNIDGGLAVGTVLVDDPFQVAGVTGSFRVSSADTASAGAITNLAFSPKAPTGGFADDAVISWGKEVQWICQHNKSFATGSGDDPPLTSFEPVLGAFAPTSDTYTGPDPELHTSGAVGSDYGPLTLINSVAVTGTRGDAHDLDEYRTGWRPLTASLYAVGVAADGTLVDWSSKKSIYTEAEVETFTPGYDDIKMSLRPRAPGFTKPLMPIFTGHGLSVALDDSASTHFDTTQQWDPEDGDDEITITVSRFHLPLTGTGANGHIIQKDLNWGIEVGGGSTSRVFTATVETSAGTFTADSAPITRFETIHDVAMTWVSGSLKVYLDDLDPVETVTTGTLTAGTGDISIGWDGTSAFLKTAVLGEVGLWSDVLTKDEIAAVHSKPSLGTATGLIAVWRDTDAATITTLFDYGPTRSALTSTSVFDMTATNGASMFVTSTLEGGSGLSGKRKPMVLNSVEHVEMLPVDPTNFVFQPIVGPSEIESVLVGGSVYALNAEHSELFDFYDPANAPGVATPALYNTCWPFCVAMLERRQDLGFLTASVSGLAGVAKASQTAALYFGAMRFNGVDQFVSFGTGVNAALGNPYTMTFDIRPMADSASTQAVLSNAFASGIGLTVSYQGAVSALELKISDTVGNEAAVEVSVEPFSWARITWTVNETGGNIVSSVYVDGILSGTDSISGTIGTSAETLFLGALNGASIFFDGSIADLAVYSVVVAEAVFRPRMIAPLTGSETDLVHHWPTPSDMPTGTTWTLTDSVGSADGTANASMVWGAGVSPGTTVRQLTHLILNFGNLPVDNFDWDEDEMWDITNAAVSVPFVGNHLTDTSIMGAISMAARSANARPLYDRKTDIWRILQFKDPAGMSIERTVDQPEIYETPTTNIAHPPYLEVRVGHTPIGLRQEAADLVLGLDEAERARLDNPLQWVKEPTGFTLANFPDAIEALELPAYFLSEGDAAVELARVLPFYSSIATHESIPMPALTDLEVGRAYTFTHFRLPSGSVAGLVIDVKDGVAQGDDAVVTWWRLA